uniref:BES15S03c n=1 Tax=Trypanosoma brucei brucei (strain 927/4 GUTat10.1) TaxID=185431 RepID=G1CRN3_TRYB2|nr:BES15S03c [Trypanosoma brucei brucei TREU927]
MPATSTWCHGPVPRIIGGSQEPAAFLSWGTLLCSGYGIIQHRDQQRLAGTPCFICRSLGTCQRAISSIIRTKMLLSGDVEENPGPSLRGMQWNCAGLSQGKRLALHKTLVDERIAFCLLSETRMTPREAACFSVAGYQHRTCILNAGRSSHDDNAPRNTVTWFLECTYLIF